MLMLNLLIIKCVFVFNLIKFLRAFEIFCFLFQFEMDPFVLSRNAFHTYCYEYVNNNNNQSLIDINHNDLNYEKVVRTVNQRYEYFLQTLDRLRTSVEQTIQNQNINSISNSEKDTLTISSISSKRSNKKRLSKSNKRQMPKVFINVRCQEHLIQQQPNIIR